MQAGLTILMGADSTCHKSFKGSNYMGWDTVSLNLKPSRSSEALGKPFLPQICLLWPGAFKDLHSHGVATRSLIMG